MPIRTKTGLKLTYDDYVQIPDDLRRHEIIDGEHIVNPAPTPGHQGVLGKLYQAVIELEKAGRAKVLFSPIDVHLSEIDVVQPDLIALASKSEELVGKAKIEGPPELVIEVLSPSTKHLDRTRKRDLYERVDVLEYWIVDLEARSLLQHSLVDGSYRETECDSGRVQSSSFPGFALDLDSIWTDL